MPLRDGHKESKSAQMLVLLKLLVPLVNIYTKDVKYEYLSCLRKSSRGTKSHWKLGMPSICSSRLTRGTQMSFCSGCLIIFQLICEKLTLGRF